jgi:hypothetical protein
MFSPHPNSLLPGEDRYKACNSSHVTPYDFTANFHYKEQDIFTAYFFSLNCPLYPYRSGKQPSRAGIGDVKKRT